VTLLQDGNHGYMLVAAYRSRKAISFYKRHGFSLLGDSRGLLRGKIEKERRGDLVKTDLRPRLYRVDEFIKLKLKNEQEVCLELIRPQSMNPHSLVPIARKISELFGRAFWHSDEPEKRWHVERIMKRLPKLPLVILAFDESRQAVGYALYNQVRWRERLILFADSSGVSGGSPNFPQNWQNSGLGFEMLKEALRQLPSDMIAARTQNAAIYPMFRKLNTKKKEEPNQEPFRILPVDAPYSDDDIELLKAIQKQIPEIGSTKIELDTGISKQIYKEGRLGDYEGNVKSEVLKQFEERMKRIDPSWSRERGDAVILIVQNVPRVD
jgi:hypothetical protein